MNSFLRLCVLCASVCSVLGFSSTAALSAQNLHVGAAAVAIEADDSMEIAGGIGPGRATGQEGELRATAVVVGAADVKVAVVSCDVLFVGGDTVDRALARIEKATGIPPAHVLVTATHTHHAPSTTSIHGYGPDERFVRRLEDAIVRSVESANTKLAGDARFFFHAAEEKTIGQNSRLLLKDGKIFWVGPRDDAVRPTGPFDPELPVLSFRGPADKLLAVLFNHSTHTIGTRKPGVRSPSFYGLAAQELEAEIGGVVAFLEGASGSTHNLGAVTTGQAVDRLKNVIRDALTRAQPRKVERLVSLKRKFTFKVRTFDEAEEERKVVDYCRQRIPGGADGTIAIFREMRKQLAPLQGRERQTWLQVMLIGDVAIVGVPAEYFTVLGLDIKTRSPFPDTYVAELANDWIGYLPDREGHALGGYQTWTGLHSYAEPGTGERMADEVVDMLNSVRRP
jgi:neutral ceramidase